ncbi:hypothetical protein BJ875DRAFT_529655 [Amylocarpus encephaloides]|uniref:Uncharacterized protein n=1 Tax=Amylocarpus encephaloides TaxID=45428 RepID=A0A9P7YKK5_9HELO|nr:hypothetical protein BJ875DRAFT_529655 [Amylocarpus encephaloides]
MFEEAITTTQTIEMLLVRMEIVKFEHSELLASVLRRLPVNHGVPGWNCIGGVKDVLEALREDGTALGTCVTEWYRIRDVAIWYVQWKKDEHRFDGKGDFDMRVPATFDLLNGKEVTP